MKYDFLVIGSSGMQGRIVARDLLESGFKIYCADLYREGSEENLSNFPGTMFNFIDLRDFDGSNRMIGNIDANVVINCAEGDWNSDVYKMCLVSGSHIIDLGSDIPMTKTQLAMSNDFKTAGIIGVTGCGSTPGINNIMFRHASDLFDEITTVELGFAWDSDVKKFVVPFSIESIVEELTDPAPYVDNGIWLEIDPAGTEIIREFREIGSQKCYMVRHPETYTLYNDYKKLGLKNLRFYAGFPEHSLEIIKKLIDLGLGAKDLIRFEKDDIRPVDAVSRILTRLPRPANYSEKENLWVEVSGKDKDKNIKIVKMECIVSTLPGWTNAGCNVDTGMPASIIAQMIADRRITKTGSFVPDTVVNPADFFSELRKKGMTVYQDGVAIN